MKFGATPAVRRRMGALAMLASLLSGPLQAQTAPPLGALQALARDAVRELAAPKPGVSDFALLAEPKFLVPGADGTYSFAEFDRVPAPGVVLALQKEEVIAQLQRLADTIEVSAPELSKEQRNELERAQTLLFEDVRDQEPSEVYRRYQDYEKRARDLNAQLGKATNPAERTNLHVQLKSTEQDWNAYGQRMRVLSALQTVSRATEDAKLLLESWREVLKSSPAGAYDRLWTDLAGTSGWTAVTITVPINGPAVMLTTQARDSQAVTRPVTGVSQLSVRALVWRIPRPALTHKFLSSPRWRSTESFVISDGLPPPSAPSELLPRVVHSLILIKGLELSFNSESSWQTVARTLAANDTVVLGGLPLKAPRIGTAFSSPKYVASAAPFVLGVVVANLPKIPNPNPTDEWPWW